MRHKIDRRHARNEQGFALPVAVGFGLTIFLIAGILIIRSSDDQMTATAQRQIGSSLSTAEGGLTRLQTFINNNSRIATYSLSAWQNASTAITELSACSSTTPSQIQTAATAFTGWQNLDSSDSSKGQFKILDYTYQATNTTQPNSAPGTGTLRAAGRLSDNSRSAIEVKIPVQQGDLTGVPVPGVWISQGDVGNNRIQGNVLVNDCSVNTNNITVTGTDPTDGQPYSVQKTDMQFPDLPPKPSSSCPTSLPAVVGNGSNARITVPPSGSSLTQRYNYCLNSLNSNVTIAITPGAKVTFYLDGGISRNVTIEHNCSTAPNGTACDPTDFQIYGYGPTGTEICLNGTNYLEAFIFAPSYTVGIAGSGGGQGGIKGAAWARNWSNGQSCGSNTSNVVAVQTANWTTLGLTPKRLPPKIAPISSWEKKEVP